MNGDSEKEVINRLYWQFGFTQEEIARILGFNDKTRIRYRMKKYNIPTRTHPNRRKALIEVGKRQRVKVNLTMSNDLAYILGVLYSDGCASGRNIDLRAIDLDFVLCFKESLERIGLNTTLKKNTENTKDTRIKTQKKQHRVTGYSKNLVEWFNSLSSDVVFALLKKNKTYVIAFLKGFFEGDGSLKLSIARTNAGSKSLNTQCSFYNTNIQIIHLIQELLKELHFKSNIYTPNNPNYKGRFGNKPAHQLYLLGGRSEVRRFLKLTTPCINRKSLSYFKKVFKDIYH